MTTATNDLSSRERMLAAINWQLVDHVPCSFMIFGALRSRCANQREFIERQLELGLDAVVFLPDLPIRFHPEVGLSEWKEVAADGSILLNKSYATPAGALTCAVHQTSDWPYGDRVPFLDDYLIPRAEKFLVTGEEDLAALAYLFQPPTENELIVFREEAKALKQFAADRGLLVAGGWGGWGHGDPGAMGVDAVMWLCGMEKPIFWGLEKPHLLEAVISLIAGWNRQIMEIYLDAGIDLFVKRAWYETTDLWSPSLYRRFMLPVLKDEVALAHQARVHFGCIMTSGVLPLAESLIESKLDVLIGVDPVQGRGTTLAGIKELLGLDLCLWGGVNGFLTVERGTPREIEAAVHQAIDILGPGGFILSPVDNVRDPSEEVWRKVEVFVEAWKQSRRG